MSCHSMIPHFSPTSWHTQLSVSGVLSFVHDISLCESISSKIAFFVQPVFKLGGPVPRLSGSPAIVPSLALPRPSTLASPQCLYAHKPAMFARLVFSPIQRGQFGRWDETSIFRNKIVSSLYGQPAGTALFSGRAAFTFPSSFSTPRELNKDR